MIVALLSVVAFVFVGFVEEPFSRGYKITNAAGGLDYPSIGPRGAVLLALVCSSVFFGLLRAGNANVTVVSTLNIVLASLLLGTGYVLTGEPDRTAHHLEPIRERLVHGFPVSRTGSAASLLSTRQSGSELWTGGSFGPEAGPLALGAELVGILIIALWVRSRTGGVSIQASIAEGYRR